MLPSPDSQSPNSAESHEGIPPSEEVTAEEETAAGY
jgi:hypothetical protein